MKIGISFFPVRPEFMLPIARKADELGYDSLWIGEHIVFPSHVESKYPYNPGAGAPLPTTPLYDPLLTYAYIAGQTKQIRFGTGIFVLPIRQPLAMIKNVTTLDVLSGGRVLFGVGSGWLKEEFDALQASWDHRGARMEEIIGIMRRLWSERLVAHEGKFYQFKEIGFEPKPAHGSIPILVGGETPIALKRAARCGDGWYGMHHTPESAAARVKELRALRGSDGPFDITIAHETLPTVDTLRRLRDAGVHRVVFGNKMLSAGGKTLQASLDGLDRFANEVMYPATQG
ncbi:MAG: LLM class F420-dependent oxidoreductase [Gammaproteobacteria bacterium]